MRVWQKGAYVVSPAEGETADVLLLATGSEVNLAVEAQKVLLNEGIHASVVSMPSWTIVLKNKRCIQTISYSENS